jgi:hypothetical protein
MPISILKCSLVGGIRRRDAYDEYSTSSVDIEDQLYRSKHICIRYQVTYLKYLG